MEEGGENRHEYVGGRIFAMSGGSREHNRISGNVFAALHGQLRGGACEVFMADMKVRIEAAGDDVFYYPDIVVACDPTDRERFFITKPSVIVEVLSPGTERIDRREKFFAYRQLVSLEAYVLISQHENRVEIYRRSADWRAEIVQGSEGALELPGLGFSMALAEIYEGVSHDA